MMNLRSFFRSLLTHILIKNAILGTAIFFMIAAVLALWNPLHAAEPETSDPAEITQDAVASLEAAKAELLPKQGELEAEEMRLKVQIDGTIGDCRQIRVEYIMASGGKIGAEGAVRTLEEVSRDPKIAELVSDKLEEARLLVTVHETEMGETLIRAEAVEASQNDLLARREEVRGKISEIKSAVATLDEAIAELKPPTRRLVGGINWASRYGRTAPEPYNPYALRAGDTVDVPEQIAACMDPLAHNP